MAKTVTLNVKLFYKAMLTSSGHLKSFYVLLKCLNSIGSGVQRSNLIKWDGVTSVFHSRIWTKVILNLNHKYLDNCVADAFTMFNRRIRKILKTLLQLYIC